LLSLLSLQSPIAGADPPESSTSYFLGRDGTPITVTRGNSPVDHTCLAHVFSQIPGQIDFFLGRARNYAPPGSPSECELNPQGVTQWLALYKMDWQHHTLNYTQDVLKPPLQINASADRTILITNAYDPSVISYNGELWVAFECGGRGLRGVSACIGPLDPNTYTISDPRRVTVLIEGGPDETGYIHPASVPNLFVFRNRVYVYWSALQIERETKRWIAAAIRGMALVQEPGGLRRFWGAGSVGRPVLSYDPRSNTEIVGVDPSDPLSDQSVDVKGVYATDTYIYVAASLGGRGPERNQDCVRGNGGSYGCFRLQIFLASTPLGNHIFNRQPLLSPKLPFNPTGYDRFFVDNHGQLAILGYFLPRHKDYDMPHVLPRGMWSFPVDFSTLRF
jgi:hypothetical protein